MEQMQWHEPYEHFSLVSAGPNNFCSIHTSSTHPGVKWLVRHSTPSHRPQPAATTFAFPFVRFLGFPIKKFVQKTNFVSYIREIFSYGSLKIQNFVCLISIRIWLESLAWRPTAGRQKLWCSPAAGKQLPRCWRRRVVTEEKAKVVAIIFLDPDSKEIILNPDSQLSLSWSGSLSENLVRPQ